MVHFSLQFPARRRRGPLPGQVQSQLLTYTSQQKITPSLFLQIFPTIQGRGGGGEEIKDSKAHEVTKNETEVIQVQCAKSKHNKGAKAISSSPPAPWGQPHHFHPEPGISVLISRARVLPVLRGSSGTAMSSQWSVLPLPSGRSSAPSLGQWDLSIG